MRLFLLIIAGIPLLNVLWWLWAHLRVRRFRHAWAWRVGVAAFALFNLAVYFAILLPRFTGHRLPLPTVVLSAAYIWSLVGLPLATLVLIGDLLVRVLWALRPRAGNGQRAAAGHERSMTTTGPASSENNAAGRGDTAASDRVPAASDSDPTASEHSAAPASCPSRRQVLAAALVAGPPLITICSVGYGSWQVTDFRIRRLDVPLPDLPPPLDGLTIAHVSDIHVGRFTRGRVLDKIVDRTNALRADLVVMSGDLIDHALADLPAGLDVLRRLDPRAGLFVCEGNHDLFEDRLEFERRVKAAGVGLLLNEAATTRVRGWPVQVLGIQWGQPGRRRDALWGAHVSTVLPLRDPAAFPILLAHHPHAFDAAAEAGLPLTLAGHTHGGQLMLTSQIGAGPMLFRYVSGLYQRGRSALVVSNGVGNWLPLRVNAPAEILHLTLRSV